MTQTVQIHISDRVTTEYAASWYEAVAIIQQWHMGQGYPEAVQVAAQFAVVEVKEVVAVDSLQKYADAISERIRQAIYGPALANMHARWLEAGHTAPYELTVRTFPRCESCDDG